jgi:hypothetical protein
MKRIKRLQVLLSAAVLAACTGGEAPRTPETTAGPTTTASAPTQATPSATKTAAASDTPEARFYSVMTDMPGRGVLMLGGEVGGPPGRFLPDLWSFDPGTGWTQLAAEAPGQPADAFAYDSESNLAVWVNDKGETFFYDPASGTSGALETDDRPQETWGSRLAYDAQSDRLILFGGFDGSRYNDETWALDVNAGRWEQRQPDLSPPAQNFHTLAYSPAADRTILFGSIAQGTWSYDYETNSWTDLAPKQGPVNVSYSSIVYDEVGERMILFGGRDESPGRTSGETWAFDIDDKAWTKLDVNTAPTARAWHSMAFDPETEKIVLFSGGPVREADPLADIWLFDVASDSWSEAPN